MPVLMTAAALATNSPPLPGFLEALSSPLQHFGVWAIGLLIMVEDFGIPVPGETILIAGAIYAGAGGSTSYSSASWPSWRPLSATT